MRLEQLVLYGPGDDDRLRFGPHVTVFAGLGAADRMELIETIVDALTGRLSNASVVFTDHRGRRVFADRTGATFADDGVVAPGPSDLLGRDPSAVAGLLTLAATDLGLGLDVTAAQLGEQLAAARAELSQLHTDHVQTVELADALERGRRHLRDLDERIASADDDRARWTWQENRRRLDQLRAELTMLERGDGAADRAILASVDALRTAGSTWADLAAAASELQDQVGPLPEVSADDLARVAATPDSPPATFLARLDAWRAAHDALRTAEAELAQISRPPVPSDDPLVEAFARLDQDKLWAAHTRLTRTAETYRTLSAVDEPEPPADTQAERLVEQAHLEVVRAQRVADQRVRPGAIGAAALAAAAVLALLSGALVVGVLALVGAAALARWLVVAPRRELAAAQAAELEALSHTEVSSWLGLHLRRLDDVTDSADRKRFESAANTWIVAQVEWEETAGGRTAEELTARADAVRARAAELDTKAAARRTDEARVQRESAATTERSARASLARGLEHYGFTPGAVADLDPEQLATAIDRRVEAGRVARRALKLASIRRREQEAAAHLDAILGRLGFTDGAIAPRLDRAIQAVAAARQRQALHQGRLDRTEIEAEIARLGVIVQRTARPGWAELADLDEEPTDPDELEARRRELARLIAANGAPDIVSAEHRYKVGLAKVRELETRLDGLCSADPGNIDLRLTERCHRTSVIDGNEESMPLLIDDAFAALPLEEKTAVLDHLVSLSDSTQVVILTDDHVVARWARSRAAHAPVTLFELETASVAVEPAYSHR
ncbi:MAG TPA: hypothetical protein PK748_01915 [Acidimicrobiales bacterium]|nr:hypothetical protein [Acidimicrobiales bacterium]HRA33650.1 hypothetical protein [Acidimicrobiales bacterium]